MGASPQQDDSHSLEKDNVVCVFADGGTIGGSPGEAIYWSVGWKGERQFYAEDHSSGRCWSDQAEYQALRAALRKSRPLLEPGDTLIVYMDYLDMVRWLQNRKSPPTERLEVLHRSVMDLLTYAEEETGVDVQLKWVGRKRIKKVLGH